MAEERAIVFVIDDDPSMRLALEDLVSTVGLEVRTFAEPQEFLRSGLSDAPGCLVLDVRLPGMSGLTFQKELARGGLALPVIFITGHGDIPMSVRAMKAGAVEFLTKPFRDQDLLDAIYQALDRDQISRRQHSELSELRTRYESLTAREREVMTLVVAGRLNKQVGGDLGISEITVKAHRGRVMAKMQARSFAELVNMGRRLGLGSADN